MNIDTQHFRELLEAEVIVLEQELATVGKKNPNVSGEWDAVETDVDRDRADETEVADGIEELENNTGVVNQLEARLREVNDALDKIKSDTYGLCDVCEEQIEEDRLEANPAAKTCKQHMNG